MGKKNMAVTPVSDMETSDIERHHMPSIDRPHMEIIHPSEATVAVISNMLVRGHSVVSEGYAQDFNRITGYEVFPEKIIARSRSAHEVGFGRFIGRRPKKEKREGHVISAATKPFSSAESAANEVVGYWALQSIGVETFDPIGAFQNRFFDSLLVVSKKRNDLMSLDRDTWVVGREVTSEADLEISERNNQTVKEVAQTLAWLHMHGIFHRDGQIKNYAVGPAGTVGVIDTENLSRYELGDPDTSELMWQDIEKLTKSLVNVNRGSRIFGVGMLHGLSPSRLQASFEELIAEPYAECLMACIELGSDGNQAQLLLDALWEHTTRAESDNWPKCLEENGN